MSNRRTYTAQDKEQLFHLVNERGMSTRAAALELGMPSSTAQGWVKKERDFQGAHQISTSQPGSFQQQPVYSNGFSSPSSPASYSGFTSSPSPLDQKQQVPSLFSSPMNATKTYKTYTPQDKENLFHLVRDRGMTTRAAAAQLDINESTAYSWISKEKEARQNETVKAETNPFKSSMTAAYPSPSPTPDPVVVPQASGNFFSPATSSRKNKAYTSQDKENLFHLIKNKGMNTHAAAVQLNINPSTAQTWVSKEKDARDSQLAKLMRKPTHPTGYASESEDDNDDGLSSQKSTTSSSMNSRKTYKSYTSQDKDNLFHLVRDKGMSTRAAAKQLDINESTAYSWVSKGSDGQPSNKSVVDEPADTNKEAPMPSPKQESPTGTTTTASRTYKKYTAQDKETLFYLIREKGMTTRAAAAQANINESTAYSWVKKERDSARELGLTSLLGKQADNNQRYSSSEKLVTDTEPVRTFPTVKPEEKYRSYTHQDKENLFQLVKDKGTASESNKDSSFTNQEVPELEIPQPKKNSNREVDESSSGGGGKVKRTYKSYTEQDKENLLYLVKVKGMSTRAAAMQLDINPSTAQVWIKKDREKSAKEPALTDEQEEFLTKIIDEQGVLTLDEMLETLNTEFKGLDISKTVLCNYAMQKYTICFTS